ncbi:MAG: DUF748 domain-containing protein [Opitutaceae bacterium]|nr:DUF748 domain-containing protein [Opitutaceae bacterium]
MNYLPLRARRWLIGIAAALLVFTVAGFWIAPPIIKAQAEKKLSETLGRHVTIGQVRLNPYALSVTLERFDIRTPDERGSFAGWDRLYVNADAFGSLFGEWVVSAIELDGFHAAVAVERDGSFNFSDILKKLSPATPAAAETPTPPARPVRIGRLAVTGAQLDFADLSRRLPFRTVIGPVAFTLTDFRTAGERGAPYQFAAVTETGEKLMWKGSLRAEPFRSQGEFSVENLALPKYAPFYADLVRADLLEGKLSVQGRYEIDLDPAKRVLRLQEGGMQLRTLRVAERDSTTAVLELPALDVAGVVADAVAMKVSIARIGLQGGRVAAQRDAAGTINLLRLLPPPAEDPVSAPAASAAPAGAKLPDFSLGELAIENFTLEFEDQAAPRPAHLSLGGVMVSLKNFSLADHATMPLQASFTWAPQGTVRVEGTVELKPQIHASVKTVAAGFEILPLSPYLEQFVNVRLTQGAVSATLETGVTLTDGAAPAVTASGDIAVEKFALVDGVRSEPLAGFGRVVLTGLQAATTPQLSLTLAEVAISGPYARVVVAEDKTINLAAVAKSEPAPATATPTPAPAAQAAPAVPSVEIGRIVIDGGDFSFTDRSLQPGVHMALQEFAGTVTGLSSAHPGQGQIDLKTIVDGAGPIAISGRLDPLAARKFVDLKVDVKNVDLTPLSPYSGKFAGYELARGQLNVDVAAKLDDRKLDLTNVVTVNQFTFGTATNSPDATGLPVRLGVALLKDSDGRIVLDVPVQGSLDDPEFRIGRVVWRVISNLLVKAATSPFTLLGSMFGGGGDELAYQDFSPGGSDLQAAELSKLATLIKALNNRPGLNLGIEGSYDRAADSYAVQRLKLTDMVRRKIWEEQRATDSNIAPPEQLVITPEQQAAILKKLFDEKFPPGTTFGTPLPTPPAVVTPPAPPQGFFKRLIAWLTFKAQREQRAAQRENARLTAEHEQAVAAAKATGLPLEEMTGRLAETVEVTSDDLQMLADTRARRVRDYLATEGQIAADRLFISKPKDPSAASAGKGPRVFLELQ